MSNLLFMDESNGNGVYASKSNNPITATTNSSNTTTTISASNINNLNNIMTATATANAAPATTLPTSISNEDLSQSLSEYTDADESISAPTEFLAEFLSAVMLKDYKKALKYCKLILQYEPNNATAKEFYPLILDKLQGAAASDSDENYNKSSSPEMVLELQCSDPSGGGESDEAASSDDQQNAILGVEDIIVDEYDGLADDDNSNYSGVANSGHDLNVNCSDSSASGCSVGESLSESVDDDDDDVDDDDGEEEEEEDEAISSSGDDLPIDDRHLLLGDDAGCAHNDSHSSRNSSSGGGGRSRSDNTTHSYSSLLLEEEDDIVPVNLQFTKDLSPTDLDVSNGNKIPSTSCSDSESPTEPLTQRLAAILRSKCGVSSTGENY